ncbi:class I SAM-dependent methyltransferase [Sungkyunkwania multivorans]|uniref:Class I SAM-dependent methyltransferase n=1 Tax=Sungkyunkwania multivorans TaxID=1173618 RepID=A0ABW3CV11_9FLAO
MAIKYDKIGIGYNRTRKADHYLSERLYHHLDPKEKGSYLDIGCGTGNYSNALFEKGVHFIGIDPSEKMLQKARSKNANIDWRLASAEKTKLHDNSVDGIIATLTTHHWKNLNKAFCELSRILKRHGRIVIFTSTPKQMQGYWLRHYFPKMLSDSIAQMPTLEKTITAMVEAGLEIIDTEKYFVRPDLEDQFLYCGKQDPKLYLQKETRNGISSFSSLANSQEVSQGLLRLQADIESGNIDTIMRSYENDLGDYLFIIGQLK